MQGEIMFYERQRFTNIWIWSLFVILNLLALFALYTQILVGRPFGTNQIPDWLLWLISGLMWALTGFFLSITMHTKISQEGIEVSYFPLIKKRIFYWKDISACQLIEYAPLRTFGGWGIRFNFSTQTVAYTVSGKSGLDITFHNGKKMLLGTRKPLQLDQTLENIEALQL